jgi:glycosyltransferase involved in cell wall biosynthesis
MEMSVHLPQGFPAVKAVFVGDGPARPELESVCKANGIDATFMGQLTGEPLAECYASGDVFCFPSFTEVRVPCNRLAWEQVLTVSITHTQTFGQVVLEALASGLVRKIREIRTRNAPEN